MATLALDDDEKIKAPDKFLDDFSIFLDDDETQSTSSGNSAHSDESHRTVFRESAGTGSDGGTLLSHLTKRRNSFASVLSEGKDQPHKILKKALHYIHAVLDGYTVSDAKIEVWIKKNLMRMFSALRDRSLPLLEVKEAMTRLSGRLTPELQRGINKERGSESDPMRIESRICRLKLPLVFMDI